MSTTFYPPTERQVTSIDNSPGLEIAKEVGGFIRRHYVYSSLYFIGMLVVAFAKGYSVDPKTNRQFQRVPYPSKPAPLFPPHPLQKKREKKTINMTRRQNYKQMKCEKP